MFVGRGYVKVTLDDETVISYANYANNNIANNSRSLHKIANAFKQDTDAFNSINDAYKQKVEYWAGVVDDPFGTDNW